VKGEIYHILGQLVSYFPELLENRIPEMQEISYVKLSDQMNKGQKTEERSLAGMLKGLAYSLKLYKYRRDQSNI